MNKLNHIRKAPLNPPEVGRFPSPFGGVGGGFLFLLLCGLVFLLSTCTEGDVPDIKKENPEILSDKLVPVNFTISDVEFDENEVVTRKGEEEVTLRASVNLPPNTKVRIVAYAEAVAGSGNHTVNVGYADYEVTSGINLAPYPAAPSPSLAVPSGSIKFVAYSFGETTYLPPFTEAIVAVNTDVMWGQTTITIGGGSANVHIMMYHLYAKVRLNAELGIGAPPVISSFNLTMPEISSNGPTLTIQSGTLTPGAISPMPFIKSSSLSTTSNWVSDTLFVFTNATLPTSLTINSIEINGTTYNGPFYVNYTKPLYGGKSYTLKVIFDRVSGGSADRITVTGTGGSARLMITRNANDIGLLFKFGGVVGINDNTSTFLNNIAFNPLANPALITAFSVNNATFSTYLPGVPCYSMEDWSRGVRNITFDTYHNLDSIRRGKGDPCRLIGMTADEIRGFANNEALYAREAQLETQGIGGWRTPTNLENQRFSGYIASTNTAAHWWDSSTGTNPSPFGTPPVRGGEFPIRNSKSGIPDDAKFLPAPGWLYSQSGLLMPSAQGYYWSSELADMYSFYGLSFNSTSVNPVDIENQTRGYTVRCVKIRPNPLDYEVSVEGWIIGGTMDSDVNL